MRTLAGTRSSDHANETTTRPMRQAEVVGSPSPLCRVPHMRTPSSSGLGSRRVFTMILAGGVDGFKEKRRAVLGDFDTSCPISKRITAPDNDDLFMGGMRQRLLDILAEKALRQHGQSPALCACRAPQLNSRLQLSGLLSCIHLTAWIGPALERSRAPHLNRPGPHRSPRAWGMRWTRELPAGGGANAQYLLKPIERLPKLTP